MCVNRLTRVKLELPHSPNIANFRRSSRICLPLVPKLLKGPIRVFQTLRHLFNCRQYGFTDVYSLVCDESEANVLKSPAATT